MSDNNMFVQNQLPNKPQYVPGRAQDWLHGDMNARYKNLPDKYKKAADELAVEYKGNFDGYCVAMKRLYDQADVDRSGAKKAFGMAIVTGLFVCIVFLAFVKLAAAKDQNSRDIAKFKKIENVVRHR